jgi:hypothetical protein
MTTTPSSRAALWPGVAIHLSSRFNVRKMDCFRPLCGRRHDGEQADCSYPTPPHPKTKVFLTIFAKPGKHSGTTSE